MNSKEEAEGESDSPVGPYLRSLSKTVREGEVTDFKQLNNGEGVRLTFKRIVDMGSNDKTTEAEGTAAPKSTTRRTLAAHLFIRKNQDPTISTYGKGKEPGSEHEL